MTDMDISSINYLTQIILHFIRSAPDDREKLVKALNYIQKTFQLQLSSENSASSSVSSGMVLQKRDANATNYSTLDDPKKAMKYLLQKLRTLDCQFPKENLIYLPYHLPQLIWDRYSQDFKEVCILGYGAFGIVVKAKHFLDGKNYAIKKVALRHSDIDDYKNILAEVKIFSQLQHPNIAMYHSSWVQLYLLKSQIIVGSGSQDCSGTSPYIQDYRSEDIYEDKFDESINADAGGSSNSIVFQDSSIFGQDSLRFGQDSLRFGQDSSRFSEDSSNESQGDDISDSKSSCIFTKNKIVAIYSSSSSDSFGSSSPPKPLLPTPTLFIQMELGKLNLSQWIKRRNERFSNRQFNWTDQELLVHRNIFTNILSALDYIHSSGCMHRDVKPANVLFSNDDGGKVLLSDFGLAKFLKSDFQSKKFKNVFGCQSASETTHIGTPTYSAPEMIGGNYDCKVDIYSLGIILLELLHPFDSMSERAKVITDLKDKNYLDPKFTGKWLHLSDLVLKMTSKEPDQRPSAPEIFRNFSKYNKSIHSKTRKNSNNIHRSYSEPQVRKPRFKVLHRELSFPLAYKTYTKNNKYLLKRQSLKVEKLQKKIKKLELENELLKHKYE